MPDMATYGGYIYASSMMAADLLITVMMFVGLSKSKSGWAHTDQIVSRWMRLCFETQLPPTIM
jgi:hypothetical protein